MEDQAIFDRFHEALDIEPRPGAYDRMRSALTNAPVVLKPRPAFRMRFTRMGFRVAAALVAAVIVVIAVVAYMSLHRPAVGVVPANHGPDLRPYQAVIARDYAATYASESDHCNVISDAQCKTNMQRFITNVQTWITDLNGTPPPAPFKEIDAMLRGHLTQAVATGNQVIAAQQHGDAAAFNAALTAHLPIRAFIVGAAQAIAETNVVTAAIYKSGVSDQADLLTSCTPCGPYLMTKPVTCAKAQLLSCIDDAVAVDAQVYGFESAVVQDAAPAPLAARETRLQTDLTAADTALMAMITAALSGDALGFNSAAAAAQTALAAVAADVSAIKNG